MSHSVIDVSTIEAKSGVFKPVGPHLGVSAFGINQLELPPHGEGPVHDHAGDGQEEVYVIVGGSGTIRVEGDEHDLTAGRYVFLSPDATRQMVAGPDGLAWIGVGCKPGSYRPEA